MDPIVCMHETALGQQVNVSVHSAALATQGFSVRRSALGWGVGVAKLLDSLC